MGELLAWQCSYRPVQWGRQTLINPVNPHPGWPILLHRGGTELNGVLTNTYISELRPFTSEAGRLI